MQSQAGLWLGTGGRIDCTENQVVVRDCIPRLPLERPWQELWGGGLDHVSARKGLTRDDDFGGGEPLIPQGGPVVWARKRLTAQFRRLAEGVQGRCNADEAETIRDRLRHALEPAEMEAPIGPGWLRETGAEPAPLATPFRHPRPVFANRCASA